MPWEEDAISKTPQNKQCQVHIAAWHWLYKSEELNSLGSTITTTTTGLGIYNKASIVNLKKEADIL